MKKSYRIISVILALALLIPSAAVLSATAEEYICPICGKDCGGWEIEDVSPATCTTPHQVKYYCDDIYEAQTVSVGEVDPYNHVNYSHVKTVDATCTESGYDLYKCTDCGEEFQHERELPLHPEGHDYAAKPAKCSDLATNYRCTICGSTKTEPRTPTEHNYKAQPFSCDDGCIDYRCTVCGALKQEIISTEHKWTDWVMTQEPTASADGERTRSCTVCTKSETETVPAGTVSKYIKSVALDDVKINYKSSQMIEPKLDAASGAKLKFEYKSSAPDVVSVDGSGSITALKAGNATITVTVTDADGFKAEAKSSVTVKYAWWQWIIRILLLGFLWY